jgi:DNA (cytosine-5)-methyltransferase 1
LESLDQLHGGVFTPSGIIGGPPCQSFSIANATVNETDPRHELPLVYAELLRALNQRHPVDFFVLENVPGLCRKRHSKRLAKIKRRLSQAGFTVAQALLNARDYQTPQDRERLFLVGLNSQRFRRVSWNKPESTTGIDERYTVRSTIGDLAEPVFFERGLDPETFPEHPNHWCMRPKSTKFTRAGALAPGAGQSRSFKTLDWDKPSRTVAYGNREVHIHPGCHRRLSVYEAMLLQGFPAEYRLLGNLSSQIAQVSEAVPPGMASAVARSVQECLRQANCG